MAYTQNSKFGYLEDTATDLTIANVPKLNYAAHFAREGENGNSVVLANTSSPMGWPEKLKFQIQDVANVYTNSGIDSVFYSPIKKGKSLLCSVQDTIKVTKATGETVMYPIQVHSVIKFPVTDDITVDDVMTVVKRQIALMFKDNNTSERLGKLIHGALNPIQ